MLFAGVILSIVFFWDVYVLKVQTTWTYLAIRLMIISASFASAYLTRTNIPLEFIQMGYALIFYFYSWYGLSFLDMTYYYAFTQGFLFFAIMFEMTFVKFLFTVIYGYILFLIGIGQAAEPVYMAAGHSFKPHATMFTSIVSVASLVLNYYITNYRNELLKLNAKFALIGRQSSFLMHEIKSPLNRVVQRMDMLQSDDLIDEIKNDSNRISSIIQGVEMLVAKPENFKTTFEKFHWSSLDEMLQRDFEGYLQGAGIKLTTNGFTGQGFGNKYLLYQVLKNLTNNALEAIDRTEESQAEIIVLLNRENDSFKLKFMNTHSSIPNNALNKVFEPMYTTKNNIRNKGMGLTFVKTIVEAHNGKIHAASAGNTTTFNLEFVGIETC